ncbi:MAG: UDP-N-acetylmuramoyl-tripeptide--D-alanyl-D-alanine ligase [Candidatus Omnitrophica bacterium]|nr:UDP-N-acetylmuramoyl-tripeptide--D-alanyl-D-alanine ligase [Candidatus Omnitrophota bacterium]
MLEIRAEEILKITKGELLQGQSKTVFRGISTDSRSIRAENIFVALKGPNFDGHDFIREVLSKGTRGAIVESQMSIGEDPEFCIIRVQDTFEALRKIAYFHRSKFKLPVIAVTGSNGKTTVKEMIYHLLSPFFSVLKTPYNYNNQIGLASTLLEIDSYHKVAVLELGINHQGEMEVLRDMVRPNIAVFTNIGKTHLEFLESTSGVLKEKMHLVSNFNRDNTIVFNNDETLLRENFLQRRSNLSLLSFGLENDADFKGEFLFCSDAEVRFRVRNVYFNLPLIGKHNIYNALAAIAVGALLGISLKDMAFHLKNFCPQKMRMNIFRIKKKNASLNKEEEFIVIDDTYNANPNSVMSAIEALSCFKTGGRKIVVMADMLELGNYSYKCHREIGLFLGSNKDIDILLTLGNYSQEISEVATSLAKIREIRHLNSHLEIIEFLKDTINDGDVLLVKGSRGMRMEEVVKGVMEIDKIVVS